MRATAKDMVLERLFSDGDELRNFKLFRGDSTDVTVEQLCEQVESTLTKIKNGLIKPTCGFVDDHAFERIDLKSIA